MIHLIDRFTDTLRQGKYNAVTIKSYRDAVFLFYNRFRDVPQRDLNEKLVTDHLTYLEKEKGLTKDAIIQTGKAIKLYFQLILERELNIKASGEKKQPPPYILTAAEVQQIIESIDNPKHKMLISLAYGAGLKLNELLNVKIDDINLEQSTLRVKDDESGEERLLNLGKKLPEMITNYMEQKKIVSGFLFTNKKGQPISPRGVQIYFSKAIEALKMDSSITIQNLRHSYAVHLLNRGIDLHHVKQALGHKYLQTTSLYTPLTNFSIEKMETPIDTLF